MNRTALLVLLLAIGLEMAVAGKGGKGGGKLKQVAADVKAIKDLLLTDDCDPNPCKNGETCIDNINGYSCVPNKCEPIEFVQLWVNSIANFSSQYSDDRFSADRVIGEPNVYPTYDDDEDAWAPATKAAGAEFLVLEFAERLRFRKVMVYETCGSGGVVRISAWNEDDGSWTTLWEAEDLEPQRLQVARIFAPPLADMDFASSRVKLDLDTTNSTEWVEIDAVKVKGVYLEG